MDERAKQAGIQGSVGLVTGGVMGKLMNPITSKTDRASQKAVSLLEKEGVELFPSQKTGSKFLSSVEAGFNDMPLTSGAAEALKENQLRQYTKAALRRAGIQAEDALPDTLDVAGDSFSKRFTGMIKKTGVKVDNDLLDATNSIETELTKRLGKDRSQEITSYIDDIRNIGGVIDGKTYQNTRSTLSKVANKSTDTFIAENARALRNALDDAAFRSLPAKDGKAWQKLRQQYGAFKTINKAMQSVGNETQTGFITPSALIGAVKAGNKDFAKGGGALNDLARAGKKLIASNIPNSGTPQRQAMQQLLSLGIGAGGYALGGLPGAVAGAVVPKVAQTLYNTPAASKYLTQGISNKIVPNAVVRGATNAVGQLTQPEEQIDFDAIGVESQGRDLFEGIDVEAPAPVILKDKPPSPQSSISPDVSQAIDYASENVGVDRNLLGRIAQVESGGNPNAQAGTSSASGLFQITKPTFKSLIEKYGDEYGYTVKDINDPTANAVMAGLLTKENTNGLRQLLKKEPSNGEIYAAHFMGVDDASNLIQNKNSQIQAARVFKKAAKANKNIFFDGKRPRTMAEVYALLTSKV